jgi:hypothetical protein
MSMQSLRPSLRRGLSLTCFLLMLVGVVAVYCPWSVLTGQSCLAGLDFHQLHERRIRFAQEAVFESRPASLPAWYPRELMGTPFWSNVQNFPFLPTRLLVFFTLSSQRAYGGAVVIAALLAATFTWLLGRRVGLSSIAASAAGWTFACCGYFAARVMAGHLPLLEAFPALPLLLWLVDRALRNTDPRLSPWRLGHLAIACACVALAGHPQLPVYAMIMAAAYALVLRYNRRGVITIATMALGVGMASFSLYPMMLLVARSTRVLQLDPATNDLAFPYGRLASLFLPWRDGWPEMLPRRPLVPFAKYPHAAWFWDTTAYIGWLPWIAVAGLALLVAIKRTRTGRFAVFIAIASALAFVLSLPFWQAITSHLPGTILRSPARLMYIVSFGLALATGAALDQLLRPRAWIIGLAVFALIGHVIDLSVFTRNFVLGMPPMIPAPPGQLAELRRTLREGRAGFDIELITPLNRAIDDIGFFDSLILAKPYRFVLDTSDLPPRLNEQMMSASQMSPRTLKAAGARMIFTKRSRPDLPSIGTTADGTSVLGVAAAAPRVELFPMNRVIALPAEQIHQRLRDPSVDLAAVLMLPNEWTPSSATPSSATPAESTIRYRRQSSDEIQLTITAGEDGYVRLLETWDPGWSATLDGNSAALVPANDVFLSLFVPAGQHEVVLRFRTPGVAMGFAISIACLLVLLIILVVLLPWLEKVIHVPFERAGNRP